MSAMVVAGIKVLTDSSVSLKRRCKSIRSHGVSHQRRTRVFESQSKIKHHGDAGDAGVLEEEDFQCRWLMETTVNGKKSARAVN
jgi:hypothetical protein